MAALAIDTAAIESATETEAATPAAIETAGIETAVEIAAAATRPVMQERTHHAARPGATRVGGEAGAVIPADTHVVTEEVETAISTGAATARAPDLPTDTTAREAMTDVIVTATIAATAAAKMTGATAQTLAGTAPPATVPLRL